MNAPPIAAIATIATRFLVVGLLIALVHYALAAPGFARSDATASAREFTSAPVEIAIVDTSDWSFDGAAMAPGGWTTQRLIIKNASHEAPLLYSVSAYSEGVETLLWSDRTHGL